MRHEERVSHLGETDEQAGHHPGKKECPDGNLPDRAVDHHHDTRRDDHPKGRRCGGHGHRIASIEARFAHRRNQHRTDTRRIRRRRAGKSGKEHADQDVDVPQPALDVTDQRLGKFDQTIGDPTVIHESSEQQKEGHREQWKGVDRGVHLVDHAHERKPQGRDRQQRGNPQGKGNRYAQEDEQREAPHEHHERVHDLGTRSPCASRSAETRVATSAMSTST